MTDEEKDDGAATARDEAVRAFVAAEVPWRTRPLGPDTDLKDAITEAGQAARLVRAFGQRFDVDVTGFLLERHFGPQAPMSTLNYLFLLLVRRDRYGFAPLRLSLFLEAARRGRWDETGASDGASR